jgi:choline dehydrogenase-like flavoprotein
MGKASVIVVGSGAGGSVAAWALARAGHPVLILEKGRNLLPGLGTPDGIHHIPFGNDEVKTGRVFENQDPILEPRSARGQVEAEQGAVRSFVGDVSTLPTTVGGGTVHWDAKVPRFWRQDFKGRSLFGPVPDANVADWPLTYDDLAPFYDEIEAHLGVQGDRSQIPASTLTQAPRSRPFAMPPNPPMLGGLRLASGAATLGYHAYPFPMAINSRGFDGRPACNSCGFCSGYGCPIVARGGAAVSFLHPALRAGAMLRTRCFVCRVDLAPGGRAATGVSYIDEQGRHHHERADLIILALSPIETARLSLLSATADHPDGLGNRSGQLGRNLMFQLFTLGAGVFADDVHTWMGPSSTFTLDDFVGPDQTPDGRAAARAAGLPYLKGGICEVGGGVHLLEEAGLYTAFPNAWGKPFKAAMRASQLRVHTAGLSMIGEDVPQLANQVDLDPQIRDVYGYPVPRITHSAHPFELAASSHYGPKLAAICQAAPGVLRASWLPVGALAETTGGFNSPYAGAAATAHIMGTARMGDDPATSVVDAHGAMHDLDNVFVTDGSVFVSSGGFNPTLTIMALALRAARQITGTNDARP